MVKDRIYDMMVLRGLTIADVSKATGITKSSIKIMLLYESRYSADLRTIRKLANCLGCTVGWLLQDKEWLNK